MSPQSILRASPRMANLMGRRMFHATRARLSSPYHYPEGPYSNLPFNTKTRFFAVRYWLYCITGFFAPFGIAGASFPPIRTLLPIILTIPSQLGKPTSPRHKHLHLHWYLVGGLVGFLVQCIEYDRRGIPTVTLGTCTYMSRTIELEANCRNAISYVNLSPNASTAGAHSRAARLACLTCLWRTSADKGSDPRLTFVHGVFESTRQSS
ncbi:hypothetical protein BKA67DRAFT_555874 [Truncatella angustata]|uniref:Cytochrome c oxidase subunit 8, mitochondrial n=1 Tax=Truncatella angustata TaxID=152316 RepID=A0A9P8ZZU9_9PEZI|nr:uncharacterized protein BKA67DRAFT_555874 [Truncatella angustata]KAH6657647.1 hypothetical protein BKA67DRAFT_555874 [Truncatella angustata]